MAPRGGLDLFSGSPGDPFVIGPKAVRRPRGRTLTRRGWRYVLLAPLILWVLLALIGAVGGGG